MITITLLLTVTVILIGINLYVIVTDNHIYNDDENNDQNKVKKQY